jgi:hypothetical protein
MTGHVIKAHKTLANYYENAAVPDVAGAKRERDAAAELLLGDQAKGINGINSIAVDTKLGKEGEEAKTGLGAVMPGFTRSSMDSPDQLPRYNCKNEKGMVTGEAVETRSIGSMNALWLVLAENDVNPFDLKGMKVVSAKIEEYSLAEAEIYKLKGEIDGLLKQKADSKNWDPAQERQLNEKLTDIQDKVAAYDKANIISANSEEDNASLDEILNLLRRKSAGDWDPAADEPALQKAKAKHPYYAGWIRLSSLSRKQFMEEQISKLEAKKAEKEGLSAEEQKQLSDFKRQLPLFGKDKLISVDIFKGVYQYYDAAKRSVITVTLIAPAKALALEREKREKEKENADKQFQLMEKGGVIITDQRSGRLIEILSGGEGKDPLRDFMNEVRKKIAAGDPDFTVEKVEKIMNDRWVYTLKKYTGSDKKNMRM